MMFYERMSTAKKRKEEIFKLALEKECRIIDIELGELIDRNVGLIGF